MREEEGLLAADLCAGGWLPVVDEQPLARFGKNRSGGPASCQPGGHGAVGLQARQTAAHPDSQH